MNETQDNRPKWMIELEDCKRKPRLAHEAGAGALCLNCKDACPGLDLHFWRKICKNCKCGRDDHDVDDDDFPQFDLLLGPLGIPKRKAASLWVANQKQPDKETIFDWVPPNTTKELATDYMKALPEDKLPIKGSPGAALRKQQLQKQLPLHDIDHKACDELSDLERQQFEKYLENLKKYVGQGKVIKMVAARPFTRSLMTPANAADMQPMSPQRKPMTGATSNLRTPSSFVPKLPPQPSLQAIYNPQKGWQASLEPLRTQQQSTDSMDVHLGQYHHALDNISSTGQISNSGSVSGSYNPAQRMPVLGRLPDENESLVCRSEDLELGKVHKVHQLGNTGSLEGHNDFRGSGMRVESNPVRQFAGEETAASGIYNPAQYFGAPNVSNIQSEIVGALEGSYNPNQQIGHLENVGCPQGIGSIAYGSQFQPGQYHGAKIPLPQVSEDIEQSRNASTLHPGYSEPVGSVRNFGNQSQAMNKESGVERVTGPISQDLASSDEVSLENARLAEQMLSDALLPPSAIHAKEIIGSTLDRSKLKFIQEHLSNKYSKDDPAAQNSSRSQQVDPNESEQALGSNRNKDPWRKPLSMDKEAERAAIIAAMRSPSGLLAENQDLEGIGSKFANPLKEEGGYHPDAKASQDKEHAMPWGSQNLHPGTGYIDKTHYPAQFGTSTNVPQAQQGQSSFEKKTTQQNYPGDSSHTGFPPQFGRSTNVPQAQQGQSSFGNAGKPIGNFGEIPMQKNYPDDSSRGLTSSERIPSEQQSYLDKYPQERGPYNFAKGQTLDSMSPEQIAALRQQHPGIHGPNPIGTMHSQSDLPPNGSVPSQQLQAELSYQSINPQLIHSESQGYPAFPEGTIETPETIQNLPSVDQLHGSLTELALGPIQVHNCHECKEGINPGDVVVTAEKAKDDMWHPGCFKCSTCNELLADLVYFYHKEKLYCARDLAALLNIPRCFACDELIFVREYTVAEGHNYHVKHFCCWDCDEPLAGQQYISENDRPLCLPCFQKTYAKTCQTCNRVIEADQQGVAVKGLDFHATDACFRCFTCEKSLLNARMAIKENRPFCSTECITEFQSKRP